jgi:hypothetical protein
METTTQMAVSMFNAYNEQGPNPWKTFDGRDVPRWDGLNDQVRAKWLAAAEASLKPSEPQVLPAGTQPPSIGRVVHFAEDGGPYMANVVALNSDGTVELATFGRNSLYFQHGVRFDSDGAKGTWRWPPRV